jgi:hypothetical protein
MHPRNPLSAEVPHTGRGRWVLGLFVAAIVVVAVIWTVASGFRGRHISRNAAAMTEPVTAPVKAEAPRSGGETPAQSGAHP